MNSDLLVTGSKEEEAGAIEPAHNVQERQALCSKRTQCFPPQGLQDMTKSLILNNDNLRSQKCFFFSYFLIIFSSAD
jgi:hypothetical protein